MKVIGHRGGAGLALENTKEAITLALGYRVEGVEIDVRCTKDNQLVLCHDPDLMQMAGSPLKVSDTSCAELQKITLFNGSNLLKLEDALELVGKKLLVIELKDSSSNAALARILDKFPESRVWVASFKHGVLRELKRLRPSTKTFGLEHHRSQQIIHNARLYSLNGIGLNFWLLNPLNYRLLRRAKLDLYVYTLNNPILAWFIGILYPSVIVCTDYPNRFTRRQSPKPGRSYYTRDRRSNARNLRPRTRRSRPH